MHRRAAYCAVGFFAVSGCIELTRGSPSPAQGGGGSLIADFGGGEGFGAGEPWASADPHGIKSVEPPHGPFSGGQRVLIRGKGFSPETQVWFGTTQAADVQFVDAGRLQVSAPAHAPGLVDVAVQLGADGSTRRALLLGYEFDAMEITPSSGPTAGGTRITLTTSAPVWSAQTNVFIGAAPCLDTTLTSASQIDCTTPAGSAATVSVRAVTGEDSLTVLDAFTYEDSTTGYLGGLSGTPLTTTLTVLAFDRFTGSALTGATAIVSDAAAAATQVKPVGTLGSVTFDGEFAPEATVTVAMKCFQPITFAKVAVNIVTAYLEPVQSTDCGSSGDLPGVGGKPGQGGAISGEIIWPDPVEFKKAGWKVPAPAAGERRAAYVFATTSNPLQPFYLPPEEAAITESSEGDVGYGFDLPASPGNKSLYVVAGIEKRTATPPTFVPYSIGLVKGVPVTPGATSTDVFVPMAHPLDQTLALDIQTPAPTLGGPDSVQASVALRLGNDGFAILPQLQKSAPIPLTGTVNMLGLPWLGGDLLGSRYHAIGRLLPSGGAQTPASVLGGVEGTSASVPLVLGDFVGAITLLSPAPGATWEGGTLSFSVAPGGPHDLYVAAITGGSGLSTWTIVSPAPSASIVLPDLHTIVPDGAVPSGPATLEVVAGRVPGLDYNTLTYANLRTTGMRAFSIHRFPVFLP